MLSCFCRFLATGETYSSLSMQFRLGITTISRIVPEVCSAIWETMMDDFIPVPETPQDWLEIANQFKARWDFPHCVGAVDGKHVVIRAPGLSGSLYFNYKGTFSMVLMALADANYKFIYVDVGSAGHNSDAGIFSDCELGEKLTPPNRLHLPLDAVIPRAEEIGPMPYVVVGDEAFPLQRHLMRPYPGKNSTYEQDSYNYRLSRARRIIECTFGILAARWRVYHTKMGVKEETVKKIIHATCLLHNMLQKETTPATAVDVADDYIDSVEGVRALRHFGTRATNEAVDIRKNFTKYFVEHQLPWEPGYLQRGLLD